MKRLVVFVGSIYLNCFMCSAQATLQGTYLQNFGTASIGAFVSNSTYEGWYSNNDARFQGTVNITTAAPTNNGGFYVYSCNGANDMKLGTRPSISTGTVNIGLRLRNGFSQTIRSLRVTFDWYQFSLAENQNNINTINFEYKTGTSVTSVTGAGWTAVSSLNFTAPQSSPLGSMNQLNGYPCTQTGSKSACFDITLASCSDEIMLRWTDINNAANDPHLAIDNVQIEAFSSTGCTGALSTPGVCATPVNFIDVTAINTSAGDEIRWIVNEELAYSVYEIENSLDAVTFEQIHHFETTKQSKTFNTYSFVNPSANSGEYYRIKQIDPDGSHVFSKIVKISNNKLPTINLMPNPARDMLYLTGLPTDVTQKVSIIDIYGKEVLSWQLQATNAIIDLPISTLPPNLYFVSITDGASSTHFLRFIKE